MGEKHVLDKHKPSTQQLSKTHTQQEIVLQGLVTVISTGLALLSSRDCSSSRVAAAVC